MEKKKKELPESLKTRAQIQGLVLDTTGFHVDFTSIKKYSSHVHSDH